LKGEEDELIMFARGNASTFTYTDGGGNRTEQSIFRQRE
jgi:hypothetical protein